MASLAANTVSSISTSPCERGKKGSFKLGWRQVDATLDHLMEIASKHLRVTTDRSIIVIDCIYSKKDSDHRTKLIDTGAGVSVLNRFTDVPRQAGYRFRLIAHTRLGSA